VALPVSHRLQKELDFKNTLKTGRTVRGDFLFLKFLPKTGISRFGISVTMKVSKKATVRNRIRRILSEIIRINVLPKVGGYDTVVVVIRNGLQDIGRMEQDLVRAFQQAGII